MWVGSIVIVCHDFPRMFAFWSAALRYAPREPPSSNWVVLEDPQHRGPNISLDGAGEEPLKDYRLHLDLYSPTPVADVERLVGLGAKVRQAASAGHDYVTLEDPDGNPFDIIDITWPGTRTDWWFGRAQGAPSP